MTINSVASSSHSASREWRGRAAAALRSAPHAQQFTAKPTRSGRVSAFSQRGKLPTSATMAEKSLPLENRPGYRLAVARRSVAPRSHVSTTSLNQQGRTRTAGRVYRRLPARVSNHWASGGGATLAALEFDTSSPRIERPARLFALINHQLGWPAQCARRSTHTSGPYCAPRLARCERAHSSLARLSLCVNLCPALIRSLGHANLRLNQVACRMAETPLSGRAAAPKVVRVRNNGHTRQIERKLIDFASCVSPVPP